MAKTDYYETAAAANDSSRQAFKILQIGYFLLPVIAGIDKFYNSFVQWEQYLSPYLLHRIPMTGHAFMQVVGAVEILAGVLVALKPRWGGYVVMLWLWGIVINLLMIPGYYDIALRDFGLSLGALALARLSANWGR
jgi:uncharacterized membrane protein YphA (DoxX/SURF4 family)